jgi:hypothetical protein
MSCPHPEIWFFQFDGKQEGWCKKCYATFSAKKLRKAGFLDFTEEQKKQFHLFGQVQIK